jgi:hypothetical protein
MQLKESKPTKRDISKILSRRITGWNDKRLTYNRIKLTTRLSYDEMSDLEANLTSMFPDYTFCIGNVRWEEQKSAPRVVTAISFWK